MILLCLIEATEGIIMIILQSVTIGVSVGGCSHTDVWSGIARRSPGARHTHSRQHRPKGEILSQCLPANLISVYTM